MTWTFLTFSGRVVSFSISQLFVRHCNTSCALCPGLPATGPVSHVSSHSHTQHPALAESQSGARTRLSRHLCDTRAIMVVIPVRECFPRKTSVLIASASFIGNKMIKRIFTLGINSSEAFGFCWGKKRKIFYHCHYWAKQRLMFDLNPRDGEYSKFELCSESSWSRGQAVQCAGCGPVAPESQTGFFISQLRARARPLYLPGGARRGRLLLRGNWCRARSDETQCSELNSLLCPDLSPS